MRTALILIVALMAPNSGVENISDLFALTSTPPIQVTTPTVWCSSFGGDDLGTCTDEAFQGTRMTSNYTILAIVGHCSAGFTGNWRPDLYDHEAGATVVVGPSLANSGAVGYSYTPYEGEIDDRLGIRWVRLSSATLPGYCRATVIGAYR